MQRFFFKKYVFFIQKNKKTSKNKKSYKMLCINSPSDIQSLFFLIFSKKFFGKSNLLSNFFTILGEQIPFFLIFILKKLFKKIKQRKSIII